MQPWDGTFGSKPVISMDRVDQLLVQLAAKSRFSNEVIREQRNSDVSIDADLKYILVRLESWEAKWLVRLILKNHCSIELDEVYVLKKYHFLLPDLLLFQDDFDAVTAMLRGELSCYPATPDPAKERCMRIEAAKKLKPVVGVKIGRPIFHKAWSFKHCFQLTSKRAWAAEVKYDGEYCEIHVDLHKALSTLKIFSKNGKDATSDRKALYSTIRDALRIGRPDCLFKSQCIVLGEMVLYSDREKKILPFSKIRKHISHSGSFLGTLQDSLPHEWEHLMLVFFDVLVLDDEPVLRHCLQDRRSILRNLISPCPGRAMRSEWSLLDFKTGDGATDLKQVFARNLASRQEGLILKPLHAPYFSLLADGGHKQAGYFVKLKKDYLGDMGGQRDLGDFAVIRASFDPLVAPKSDIRPLHWTHFHLGCCVNTHAVQRAGAKPRFKVVACLSLHKCIPKADVKYLNMHGYVRQTALRDDGSTAEYDIEHAKGYDARMTAAFRTPFVVEVLGSGFETLQNEAFEMLRHPRVTKIHHDRTWEDAVSMPELEKMAREKWDVPDAAQLDGHARDVAALVARYVGEIGESQDMVTTGATTQETTQRDDGEEEAPEDAVLNDTAASTRPASSPVLSPGAPRALCNPMPEHASARLTTSSPDPSSPALHSPSTKPPPLPASLKSTSPSTTTTSTSPISPSPTTPSSSNTTTTATATKRPAPHPSTPRSSKRRRYLRPLTTGTGIANRVLGAVAYESQEGVVHVYAKRGVEVRVHVGEEGGEWCC